MTPLVPINVDVTTALVALATVLTALVAGLVTLARPSVSTVTWGIAFGVGMLGAYLWLAGQEADEPMLRAAASALVLSFEPLIWIGLRMHFGRRERWGMVVPFLPVVLPLLLFTAGTPWYLPVFHLAYLASAVYGGCVAYELWRDRTAVRDIQLPLALASCALVAVAVVSAVSSLLAEGGGTEEQLDALRGMNAVGALVVGTCAAFTLALMVRSSDEKSSGHDLAERSRRRLLKAKEQNDQTWSVLDIWLDDPADLREASSGSAYSAIVDRFHEDIEEALPASADADRVGDAHSVVVIRGSDESVRHYLREILNRVSVIERDATTVSGIRSSASIGWVTAATAGFDYDALVAAAGQAAARARAAGGDQWKRASSSDLMSTTATLET